MSENFQDEKLQKQLKECFDKVLKKESFNKD